MPLRSRCCFEPQGYSSVLSLPRETRQERNDLVLPLAAVVMLGLLPFLLLLLLTGATSRAAGVPILIALRFAGPVNTGAAIMRRCPQFRIEAVVVQGLGEFRRVCLNAAAQIGVAGSDRDVDVSIAAIDHMNIHLMGCLFTDAKCHFAQWSRSLDGRRIRCMNRRNGGHWRIRCSGR